MSSEAQPSKDQKRYCIGCKHLRYDDKEMGYGGTMTGSWTYEDASISCGKGHWKRYLTEGPVGFDFEKAMEHAQSCQDYEERST